MPDYLVLVMGGLAAHLGAELIRWGLARVRAEEIRVLVVDSHEGIRRVLRITLMLEPNLRVIDEATTGPEAVDKAQRLKPNLVTVPVILLGSGAASDGLQTTRLIRRTLPSTKVLVVSTQSRALYIDAARDAGASGYLLKPFAPADLLHAVRTVLRNASFFGPPEGNVGH